MRKSRGESITSCLSRSHSSDSELNIRLLSLVASPSRQTIRCGKRNISECSDRTNLTQGSLSTSMESYCRICHDGDNDEKLMRACRCQGSIKHVHHECLLNWVSRSGDLTCEICKYSFNVIRSRRKRFSEVRIYMNLQQSVGGSLSQKKCISNQVDMIYYPREMYLRHKEKSFSYRLYLLCTHTPSIILYIIPLELICIEIL